MFKPFITAAAIALATTTAVALPVAPAAAQNYGWDDRGYGGQGFQNVGWRNDRRYNNNRRYSNNRNYRGNQRCRDKGNGGLAIGGIAGGLAGNTIAGRGDKTLGTILGAGGGALAGRAIDKSDGRPC
ncbi:glycine zipper 2TM domain-containing protein [Sphingomonas solaris]|uniref:17 kDa surface antigen n=1 Tax=Alterirhizorhabdus solaris TaxID=2529389 RepID=A0A558QS58_9SPHN|nr:glycine zipper 2TM domain-containing protein [Sphingomonas solaris]TVV69892.1 glycine zipper 2TM domain-containing protein [Sphingomonas solaris]